MDRNTDAMAYGFRARAAQLLSWLTGVQQQERQQQIVQADRLTNDGADRGIDDPDNRRQQPLSGQAQQTAPGGVTRADMEAFRTRMQTNPAYQREMDSGYRPPARLEANRARHEQDDTLHGPAQDRLAAQLQALQERLQAQQQAQRGRSQGRGW